MRSVTVTLTGGDWLEEGRAPMTNDSSREEDFFYFDSNDVIGFRKPVGSFQSGLSAVATPAQVAQQDLPSRKILILSSDSPLTTCHLPALSPRSSSKPPELMGEQPGTVLSGASV
ncbi:hypothetical protein EYF80_032516 [Liparis tanakae]|uniref:Uncharacterized protein n=1 Tax=Liparis tanakae TaxID=230148 RepID=A0A4Z2GUH6_9TELE|nr:hypothetical protein EYF80_032516 [Liparis tanakae]